MATVQRKGLVQLSHKQLLCASAVLRLLYVAENSSVLPVYLFSDISFFRFVIMINDWSCRLDHIVKFGGEEEDQHHLATLIVCNAHAKVKHSGVCEMTTELRSRY